MGKQENERKRRMKENREEKAGFCSDATRREELRAKSRNYTQKHSVSPFLLHDDFDHRLIRPSRVIVRNWHFTQAENQRALHTPFLSYRLAHS